MKKFYLLLILMCIIIFSGTISIAQSYDTTSYYGKMNYIFNNIDNSQIGTGLLREYGIDFLNPDNYTGTALHDSNWVNLTDWRVLYASLYSEQINSNANLLSLDTINNLIGKYAQSNLPVTFACLYYNFQSLDNNAVANNLFTISNDQLYDVSGRTQSPYITNNVFAIAPTSQSLYIGDNKLIFRPELFLGNTGKTISSLQIDPFGTGSYQTVNLNENFTVNYADTGLYTVNFIVNYTDNTVNYSHTKFVVNGNNNSYALNDGFRKGFTGTGPPYVSKYALNYYGTRYPYPVPQLDTATKAYAGVYAEGDITIDYAQNNPTVSVVNNHVTGEIRKPLIVVDGFDPEANSATYPYSGLIYRDPTGINKSLIEYINNDPNIGGGGISLNYGLDNLNEYDIIYVHWKNGTDYIQRNAYLLEYVIQEVNNIKTTWNGVRQQNVIIGLSMAGLVARYALRDMELNNINHETRLFISHDAPHWGANVPVGYQALVQHLAPWKILNAGIQGNFPGFYIQYRDMFPNVVDAINLFNTPAAKQMLLQRYILNSDNNPVFGSIGYSLTAENSTHTAFMNEINSMGWPVNCKNITLSNGACNGATQFDDNSRMISMTGSMSLGSYWENLWKSLLYTMGGEANLTGAITNGVPINNLSLITQLPLAWVTTKGSTIADFGSWSVPASGTSLIYQGDFYTQRQLFWGLFNIKSYFIKCHVNSTSDMLPLDNAPGGKYDLSNFGLTETNINDQLQKNNVAWIKAKVIKPSFCFVPTVSALAFSNPQQYYRSSFCSNINCYKSPNVSDYYAPQINQIHMSCTQDNANWILQEQDPNYSCATICPANLAIAGDNSFCTTSNPYTLSGLPANASVAWSVSRGIVNIDSPNSQQTTLTKITDGVFDLSALVTNGCASNPSMTITRNTLGVGLPYEGLCYYTSNGLQYGLVQAEGGVNSVCFSRPTTSVTAVMAILNATSSSWTLDNSAPGLIWSGDNNLGITFKTANIEGDFIYSAANACGSIEQEYLFKSVTCGKQYAISPNPANAEITITDLGTESTDITSNKLNKSSSQQRANTVTITVYDGLGAVKKTFTFSKGNNYKLNVSDLIPGLFYLNIFDGTNLSVQKVIIQK